jgi:hypothetical protein
VGSIAVGRIFRVLALAKKRGFGFRRRKDHGPKFGRAVVAVAKGLFFRETAGAPSILFAGFQFDLRGMFGGDMGFRHGFLRFWVKDTPRIPDRHLKTTAEG